MHQHQGLGWILLSPMVFSLCPTMPSACTIMPWMEPVLAHLTCTALSPESHPSIPSETDLRRGQENRITL